MAFYYNQGRCKTPFGQECITYEVAYEALVDEVLRNNKGTLNEREELLMMFKLPNSMNNICKRGVEHYLKVIRKNDKLKPGGDNIEN